MNIPKNKDETFYADINIFFSTYLPVYIHKSFFNFCTFINRELIANSYLTAFNNAFIDNEASRIEYLVLHISS